MLWLVTVAILATIMPNDGRAGGSKEEARIIAQGGRLYDKWWQELDLSKPNGTHPAYPATGKQKGAATWRCKECHGWDYRGGAGAYKKGSHHTGITGVHGLHDGDEQVVRGILRDKTHGFTSVLPDEALRKIARFVVAGQVDIRQHVDARTKQVRGDRVAGRKIFKSICARCHGPEGNDMNFSRDANDPEYLGTVASKNPWEAIHKLRNGHPGAFMDHEHMHMSRNIMMRHHQGLIKMGDSMPFMREKLSLQQQIDLLSYLQTLPAR
jgi:thiosulfate dehydrogenase